LLKKYFFLGGSKAQRGVVFQPQPHYSEPVERQRLSNFVRPTRMAPAGIEASAKLPVPGLSRKASGRAVSC